MLLDEKWLKSTSKDAVVEETPQSRIFVCIVALTCMALNQSGLIFGLNLSLADPLLIIALLFLMLERRVVLPRHAFIFFLLLTITTIATALFFTPVRFGTTINESKIFVDFVKMLTSLAFLTFGYNLAASGLARTAVHWFATGAAIVAIIGVTLNIAGIHVFDATMYYHNVRFRGLMIDPNYYAILACAAIAYFVRDRRTPRPLRIIALLFLGYSIVISGSKTGTVALLILAVVLLLEYAIVARRSVALTSLLLGSAVAVIAAWDAVATFTRGLANQFGYALPQLTRLAELFDGSLSAASGGGSDRVNVWGRGLDIVESSPILGVGIGSYSAVGEEVSGLGTLAHNTYIQLAAEWGLPLAALFILLMIILLVRSSQRAYSQLDLDALLLRDLLLVLMIGSISLSLNNARMFWLFLGMIIFITSKAPAATPLSFDSKMLQTRAAQ